MIFENNKLILIQKVRRENNKKSRVQIYNMYDIIIFVELLVCAYSAIG